MTTRPVGADQLGTDSRLCRTLRPGDFHDRRVTTHSHGSLAGKAQSVSGTIADIVTVIGRATVTPPRRPTRLAGGVRRPPLYEREVA